MSKHNPADGVRIAMEMERRGIRLYARAQRFANDADLLALLRMLEAEETEHLTRFTAMLGGMRAPTQTPDEKEIAAALAAEHFFPGGLMQAALDGAFTSSKAMLEEAMTAERDSIAFYRALRDSLQETDRATLDTIVREEEGHLQTLARHKIEIEEAKG